MPAQRTWRTWDLPTSDCKSCASQAKLFSMRLMRVHHCYRLPSIGKLYAEVGQKQTTHQHQDVCVSSWTFPYMLLTVMNKEPRRLKLQPHLEIASPGILQVNTFGTKICKTLKRWQIYVTPLQKERTLWQESLQVVSMFPCSLFFIHGKVVILAKSKISRSLFTIRYSWKSGDQTLVSIADVEGCLIVALRTSIAFWIRLDQLKTF